MAHDYQRDRDHHPFPSLSPVEYKTQVFLNGTGDTYARASPTPLRAAVSNIARASVSMKTSPKPLLWPMTSGTPLSATRANMRSTIS